MSDPHEILLNFRAFNKFVDEEYQFGRCTLFEAALAKLRNATNTLLDLKMPETWEQEEYGYMARTIN